MDKTFASSDTAAAQASKRGCGCRGHGKQVQVEKMPIGVQEQSEPSTLSKHVQAKQTSDHAGCCCGGKADR